jgi:hypothetical protein
MESIEEVIFPAMSLVFLMLGLMLLVTVLFSSFNPYDQIAFANTEKLRSAMNEACVTGSTVKLGTFEMSQNIPAASWLLTVLPRWLIRNSGDPNYIIYYEAFPPGEAAGWEVYHPLNNRLVVNLPDNFDTTNSKNGNSVRQYVNSVRSEYMTAHPNDIIDAIVVGNIVLSGDFRNDFIYSTAQSSSSSEPTGGPVSAPTTSGEKFFGYGKWKFTDRKDDSLPAGGANQFKFTNYMGLTNLEKTLIKYQTCGVNSLCLKTRNAVYTYPLDQCKQGSIKGVYLAYDARQTKYLVEGIGYGYAATAATVLVTRAPGLKLFKVLSFGASTLAIKEALTRLFQYALGFKMAPVTLVSPCRLSNVEIVQRPCDKTQFLNLEPGDAFSMCKEPVASHIYQYSETSGLTMTNAVHYSCTDTVGNDAAPKTVSEITSADQCIVIRVSEPPQGYCWTPNPYKKGNNFIQDFSEQIYSKFIGDKFSLFPITDNTDYFSGVNTEGFVLETTQTTLKKGEAFYDAMDRKWWWGWPGGLSG